MALQGAIPVEFGEVFPHGCFVVGEVQPVRDFDRSSKDSMVQAVDKDSGQLLWSVDVLDGDQTAGDKVVRVKLVGAGAAGPAGGRRWAAGSAGRVRRADRHAVRGHDEHGQVQAGLLVSSEGDAGARQAGEGGRVVSAPVTSAGLVADRWVRFDAVDASPYELARYWGERGAWPIPPQRVGRAPGAGGHVPPGGLAAAVAAHPEPPSDAGWCRRGRRVDGGRRRGGRCRVPVANVGTRPATVVQVERRAVAVRGPARAGTSGVRSGGRAPGGRRSEVVHSSPRAIAESVPRLRGEPFRGLHGVRVGGRVVNAGRTRVREAEAPMPLDRDFSWMLEANCLGCDSELFFPERGASNRGGQGGVSGLPCPDRVFGVRDCPRREARHLGRAKRAGATPRSPGAVEVTGAGDLGVSWAEVPAVRLGRNWLRVGDRVHVCPSRPRRRDGFDGRVARVLLYPDGHVEVEVHGGPKGMAVKARTVLLERIVRRAQTRNGHRIGVGP